MGNDKLVRMPSEIACDAGASRSVQRFRVFHAGRNRARWSAEEAMEFVFDRESYDLCMSVIAERAIDMVVDYEHHTEGGSHAAPDGRALAAGWVRGFDWVPDDGLYVEVEWTERAARAIAAREYRYFSPVFRLDNNTNRVKELVAIALTNTPALIDIDPIAATRRKTRTSVMPTTTDVPTAILDALGLPEDATLDQVLATINELKEMSNARPKGGDGESQPDKQGPDVPAQPLSAKIDPTVAVPIAEFVALKKSHDELVASFATRLSGEFLARGMADGKIVASTVELWRDMFRADSASAEKHLLAAPVILSMNKLAAEKSTANVPDRASIIAASKTKYAGDPGIKKMTSLKAYANMCLADGGMTRLTDAEAATL